MSITVLSGILGDTWSATDGTTASNANTGLIINGSNPGVHRNWGSAGTPEAKPIWATSNTFIESTSGGWMFEFMDYTTLVNSGEVGSHAKQNAFINGIEVECGFQMKLNTFTPDTVPANNVSKFFNVASNAADSDYAYFLTLITKNRGGYNPGFFLTFHGSFGSGTRVNTWGVNGGSVEHPAAHLAFDVWRRLKLRIRRSTGDGVLDGTVQVYIENQLIAECYGCDMWFDTASGLRDSIMRFLSGWTSETGITARHCGPYYVREVPDADNIKTVDWSENATQQIKAFYPARFIRGHGNGAQVTISGTATLPVVGTPISTSGVDPEVDLFRIPGTVGQTFESTFPEVWTGTGLNPWNMLTGELNINFMQQNPAGASVIKCTIYKSDNTTKLFEVELDDNARTIKAYEFSTGSPVSTTLVSSCATDTRFQFLTTLKSSEVIVHVVNITDSGKSGIWKDFSVSAPAIISGQLIGKVVISGTHGSSVTVEHAGVAISSTITAIETDSFVEGAVNLALTGNQIGTADHPPMQSAAQRMGGVFRQLATGECIPGGWDPCPRTGGMAGITVQIVAARSGYRLSESTSGIWPNIQKHKNLFWILCGGVVNDTTNTTTLSAARTEALSIANNIVALATMAVSRGGGIWVIDAPNSGNGGSMGAGAEWRRITMGLVAQYVDAKLPVIPQGQGTIFHSKITNLLEGNKNWMDTTDLVHPNESVYASRWFVKLAHDCIAMQKGLTGRTASGALNLIAATQRGRSDRSGALV